MQNKILILIVLSLGLILTCYADTVPLIGDESDGSRSNAVHLIQAIDEDSATIRLSDQPHLPFSTANTCGKCHDYSKISHGWHFNAGLKGVDDGRPGHPWLFVDKKTGTQIPLSLRHWEGVYKPADIGLSAMEFVQLFGRQMPGGGIGENDSLRAGDDLMRWEVTGNLDVNCLSCHNAAHQQDQAEWADQVKKMNFRWASTAASGLAKVLGSAKDLPVNYDIYWGEAPDAEQMSPHVYYNAHNFNKKSEVFFDITAKSPNERCYACHSTIEAGTQKWRHDGDVHIQAGMLCVDCHKNGLDHAISRGYESDIHAGTETCESCHLGGGDHKAPKPAHEGFPLSHFEELSCTACHSGILPQEESGMVKTSMGHGLGVHGSNKSAAVLPHIISPVFVEDEDNEKITPHNLIWPSFWAEMKGDSIKPLNVIKYSGTISAFIENTDSMNTGNWLTFNENTVKLILDSLKSAKESAVANPVYISGGKLYKISDGKLISAEHVAAKPYMWAVAHDVRPAKQALGAGGCSDCHSLSSPFFFGKILIDTPVDSLKENTVRMASFEDSNVVTEWLFSFSFFFRPWLKLIILIGVLVIFAIVVIYAFRGLGKLTVFLSQKD